MNSYDIDKIIIKIAFIGEYDPTRFRQYHNQQRCEQNS